MSHRGLPQTLPSISHRTRLLRDVPVGELLIHEIYPSIQGESSFAGLPCVFVRTAVCDLRCRWCDSAPAFTQGERLTRLAVRERALSYGCPLIEITGGEPLLQPEVLPLMTELCDAGKTVLLETSGAHDIGPVDPRVHIIMDVKCPDSGESERNLWSNLDRLPRTAQVKFVIASRRDWDWALQVIRDQQLDQRLAVLVSGSHGTIEPRQLAEWVLESGRQLRLQLQLHKYIWGPTAQGV